jgi:hypothetical protein
MLTPNNESWDATDTPAGDGKFIDKPIFTAQPGYEGAPTPNTDDGMVHAVHLDFQLTIHYKWQRIRCIQSHGGRHRRLYGH